MREHPPRQVIRLPSRQTEAGGERAALRPDIAEHGRIREVDRELGVCSAELLVELVRGRGDAGPVKAGVGVGARLPVGQRLDRREGQVAGVERDPVTAQHRLRVLIGRAPRVAVVGIDGLVLRQQHQRPPAEVLERGGPAREAALQLARGIAGARLSDQPVALCSLAVETPAQPGRLSSRPELVDAAAGAAPAAS